MKSATELPPLQVVPQENIRWDQTTDLARIVSIISRDGYRPPSETAPHGEVKCPDDTWRHIIGHDTAIDKGVHLSYGLHQNIIVDMDKDPVLQTLYKHSTPALEAIGQADSRENMEKALQGITNLTEQYLPYNEQKVLAFLQDNRDKPGGDFPSLGDFVMMSKEGGRVSGAGICLQQALLSGVLIENAIKEGKAEGEVAVYRNHDLEEGVPHAWVVYRNEEFGSWYVDPANGSVNSLDTDEELPWRYGLTEEQ